MERDRQIDRAVGGQRTAQDHAVVRRRKCAEPLVDHRHELGGDERAPLRVARILLLPIAGLREHRDDRRDRLVARSSDRAPSARPSSRRSWRRRARTSTGIKRRPSRRRNRAAGRTRRAACRRATANRSVSAISSPFGAEPAFVHFRVGTRRRACALPIAGPANAWTVSRVHRIGHCTPCRRAARIRGAHWCTTCSRDTTRTCRRCASVLPIAAS